MGKKNYFAYNNGGADVQAKFRISASQVSKFFDATSQWYREHLLGETGFEGSTSSELGNCVHVGAEMYSETSEIDYEQIDNHIAKLSDEFDRDHISAQYGPMLDALIPFIDRHKPTEVEKFVFHEILPGIGAGGSIDALTGLAVPLEDGTLSYPDGATIMDWKTTGQKTPPTKFTRAYWFQQMTYAWVLKQKGIDVRWIKLVYITQNETGRVSEKTGKALKDYPSQVSVVTEEVTEKNLELIGSCLQLIAESVQMWNTNPEFQYLLAQDLRLKINKPVLFKKD